MWRRRPFPKRKARDLDRAFVWRNRRPFAAGVAIFIAAGLLVGLILPTGVWLFTLGAVTASAFWLLVYVTVISSGSIHARQGSWGEDATRDELKKLRKDAWTYFHGIDLGVGDVDFVAIGPAGVVVIESKWLNEPLDRRWRGMTARSYLKQVMNNAERVRSFLAGKVISVHPKVFVVVWGPGGKDSLSALDDRIFHGSELASRIRALPRQLNDAQQTTITHELREFARSGDSMSTGGVRRTDPAPRVDGLYSDVLEQFGVSVTGGPKRFTGKGWFHVGSTVARCRSCARPLEGYRRPYVNRNGGTYHYWALVCLSCRQALDPSQLDDDSRAALYESSTYRPDFRTER